MSEQEISEVIMEYGSAIRLDWGNIDGRWVRDNLNDIAMWVRSPNMFPGMVGAREALDICPKGEGHWTEHCWAPCKEES